MAQYNKTPHEEALAAFANSPIGSQHLYLQEAAHAESSTTHTPMNGKLFHRALRRADPTISTSAANAYIQNLTKAFCTTYEKIAELTSEDMRELGIPVGHRKAVQKAALAARNEGNNNGQFTSISGVTGLANEGVNSSFCSSPLGKKPLSNNNIQNNCWISMRGKATQFRAFAMAMYRFAIANGFTSTTAEDVSGLSDMRGSDYLYVDLAVLPEDLNETMAPDGGRGRGSGLHMPTNVASNEFMKLFDPSQQMPIVICHTGARTFGLRIRVPDLETIKLNHKGINIQDITNRVCFLVKDVNELKLKSPSNRLVQQSTSDILSLNGAEKPGGLVITFDSCDDDPLKEFLSEQWNAGEFYGNGIDEVVSEMILSYLHLYSEALRLFRRAVDDLDDPKGDKRHTLSDADLVKAYTTVAKRSVVLRRCAVTTREAILELGERIPWMQSHCLAINNVLDSIITDAEEVSDNANESMSLTIALSDFESNQNMKFFTYVTVLLQPIAVGTGWYGMNWITFPELSAEHGYRNFALIICSIAVVLLMLVAQADILSFAGTLVWRLANCWDGIRMRKQQRPRKASRRGKHSVDSVDDSNSPTQHVSL